MSMNHESDFENIAVDPLIVKRERERARKLKESAWWKRKRSSGVCYYCGQTFKPSLLTMDHKIPISRGGLSEKENIVPCCKECNSKKKSMMSVEWSEYLNLLRNRSSDNS